MAGGKQLGSVVAKVGADTSTFQEALNAAGASMKGFEKEAARIEGHISNGIQKPMALAGNIAGQFAGQLSVAATSVTREFGALGVATTNTLQSVAGLGDQMLSGAAAFGKLSGQALDFTKMSAGTIASMGSLVAIAASLGYGIGTLANNFLHLEEITATAEKPLEAYADLLAENEETFRNAVKVLEAQERQLGLTGEQWKFNAEWTEENARRIAYLMGELQEQKEVEAEVAASLRAKAEAQRAAGRAAADQLASLAQYNASLRETYGILSQHEVETQLRKTVQDFRELMEQGISADEATQGFASRFEDLARHAANYKDLGLPESVKALVEAVLGPGGAKAAIEAYAETIRKAVPQSAAEGASDMPAAIAPGVEEAGRTLSGGFGKGIEEGLRYGEQKIEEYRQRLEGKMWKISLDYDRASLASTLREMGFDVPNTGQVPA